MHVEGRDAPRPADAVVVVVLLHGRRGDAREADAVAAHHDGAFLAVLVEERRPHGHGVLEAELEDVADLDHARALELVRAVRAGVARARVAQVREGRLGHLAERDAAAVEARLVGAGDVGAPAQRLVGEDGQRRGHGADEAGLDALGLEDLLRSRHAEVGAERAAQLELAELVVAAHEDHDGAGGGAPPPGPAPAAGPASPPPSGTTTSALTNARAGRPR